jgi:hypothetical protein
VTRRRAIVAGLVLVVVQLAVLAGVWACRGNACLGHVARVAQTTPASPLPYPERHASDDPFPSPSPAARPAPGRSPGARPPASAPPIIGGRPGAWPGPANTGVPAGTALTVHAGDLMSSRAGQVIDAVDVRNGSIIVQHDNVTVRRSKVTASATANGPTGVYILDGHHGVTVEDCEIDMADVPGGTGVGYAGLTVQRCNIHNAEKGIQIGDSMTALDNWVHDPYTGGNAHTEDVAIFGTNVAVQSVVRHNTLANPKSQTAVVFIKTDQGLVNGVTVDGNYLDGGNYTVYSVTGTFDGTTPPQNVAVTNNVFTHGWVYGPRSFDGVVTFAGNAYTDGSPVG